MSQLLARPFSRADGSAYSAPVSAELFPEWDDVTDPMRSCLVVSEDGIDLGPPHTSHQEIGIHGRGRYSHWGGTLVFSASDNTDPNVNGRRYEARWDQAKYFDRRAIQAIAIIESWVRRLPGGVGAFAGKAVLEIGPGRDMGTVIALAALGARRVVAVDRFAGAWQSGWHEPFLDALRNRLPEFGANVNLTVLDRVREAGSFQGGPLEVRSEPFEQAGARLAASIDLSVSHSTFEHFYSAPEAAAALFAATAPGGGGVHNVDFRDHRNFGTPLEFLLVPDAAYAEPSANDLYGRGNRVRPAQMRDMLLRAGFSEATFLPDQRADRTYLVSVEDRLRTAESSYRGLTADGLAVLSGAFVLRR